jgi:hypothetical protein
MEKNLFYEKLSAYVDGELPPDQSDLLEREIALSPDLQKKLEELRKLKQLTSDSSKKLPESPYFETKLFASLSEHKKRFSRSVKFYPIAGFLALTVLLMIFLKFNPQIIDRLVEQQKTNLAGFYKQNLKPLLFAADLSNEDIFNFAFYHQLPLDKTNSQYLQLGYDTAGNGFFEIKTGNVASNQNNLDKFVKALNLNSQQKGVVDSLLQAYAEDLQTQVLVNDKNTVAINPNIWNYNKAILADIISFARNTNKKEFLKICPAGVNFSDNNSVANVVKQIKKTKDDQYIFFTPDTIFSEQYVFDKHKFKEDMKKMKDGMKSASQNWQKMAVNLHLDGNIDKLRRDPSWGKGISVQFNKNTCRVNLPNLVPEIIMPDFDSITVQIERAAEILESVTVNIPELSNLPGLKNQFNYKYKMNTPLHPDKQMDVNIDLDSIMANSKQFKHFFEPGKEGIFNVDSLVASIKSMMPDSLSMHEFQKEMKRFQQQMQELQKEFQKSNKNKETKKKSIEI